MIKEIDSLLRLWAQELHSEHSKGGLAGGNMVAMMMESNGQLIRLQISRGRVALLQPRRIFDMIRVGQLDRTGAGCVLSRCVVLSNGQPIRLQISTG